MSAVSCHDVAKYILEKAGEMTAMKLQKLLYYSQAWSMVWDGEPLFNEPIVAWWSGPLVFEVYELHRDRFKVSEWPRGDGSRLSPEQREAVDAVQV